MKEIYRQEQRSEKEEDGEMGKRGDSGPGSHLETIAQIVPSSKEIS